VPDQSYSEKQAVQVAQYKVPYHWLGKKRVEAARYFRMTRLIYALVEQENKKAGKDEGWVILDIGCGDGRNSYLLWEFLKAEGRAPHILGLDVSPEAVDWARTMTEEVPGEELRFEVGDHRRGVECLEGYEGPVVVVLREVIEHLPEEEIDRIFQDLRLLPECRLLVSVPSTNSPLEEKHFRHYEKANLKETFERNGFYCSWLKGFGYRPASLYRLLRKAKGKLNRWPVFWRLMNPLWRVTRPEKALTLVSVGEPKSN